MKCHYYLAFILLANFLCVFVSTEKTFELGKSCSSIQPCNSTQGLVCSDGKCICASHRATPETFNDACRARALHSCIYTKRESFDLGLPFPSFARKPCVSGADCVNGFCKCDNNHHVIDGVGIPGIIISKTVYTVKLVTISIMLNAVMNNASAESHIF